MKFSITNNGGQFQFWHTDCGTDNRERPMHAPKNIPDNVKEFKCVGCEKVGRVTMEKITTGSGELEEEGDL